RSISSSPRRRRCSAPVIASKIVTSGLAADNTGAYGRDALCSLALTIIDHASSLMQGAGYDRCRPSFYGRPWHHGCDESRPSQTPGAVTLRSAGRPQWQLQSIPPPALGERRHSGLARRGVAVRRRAIFMLPEG